MINLFHKAKLEPFDNLLIASEHNVTMNVEPSLLQEEEEEGAAHMEYHMHTCTHAHMRSPTISQSSTVVVELRNLVSKNTATRSSGHLRLCRSRLRVAGGRCCSVSRVAV
jgi:hypothetical protein